MNYGIGGGQSNAINSATERPRTQLESHLDVLRGHQKALDEALMRATRLADRLLGSVPTPISKDGRAADAKDPPLVAMLDYTGRDLTPLIQGIHEQLNRLEAL